MTTGNQPESDERGAEFAELAEGRRTGLVREYLGFIRHTGKWWLIPIFAMLGLIGGLILLGGTGAAPFIYALF